MASIWRPVQICQCSVKLCCAFELGDDGFPALVLQTCPNHASLSGQVLCDTVKRESQWIEYAFEELRKLAWARLTPELKALAESEFGPDYEKKFILALRERFQPRFGVMRLINVQLIGATAQEKLAWQNACNTRLGPGAVVVE